MSKVINYVQLIKVSSIANNTDSHPLQMILLYSYSMLLQHYRCMVLLHCTIALYHYTAQLNWTTTLWEDQKIWYKYYCCAISETEVMLWSVIFCNQATVIPSPHSSSQPCECIAFYLLENNKIDQDSSSSFSSWATSPAASPPTRPSPLLEAVARRTWALCCRGPHWPAGKRAIYQDMRS